MAVKAGTAYVDFAGDFSALNKQVSSHFSTMAKQAAPAGKKIGKGLGAGMATGISSATKVAAVGVAAVTAEVVKATKGWSEHQAIVRRSNAVIKSTGGLANVSAKHIGTLTDAIERQVGVDGDLAAEGANLLLTFTNIRNGVGKNNKIFDQATRTTVNMSKALGQDTKNSAIQLGKALNDPVKGVTALSKVGVSFTDQQKKTIKSLVDSGKTMDAQKIILRELGKEFPKVKATPFERLVSVGRQVEDTIGKNVLPIFDKLVRNVTPGLQRIADKAEAVFGNKNLSIGERLTAIFKAVKVEVAPLISKLETALREAHLGDKFGALVKSAEPVVLAKLADLGKAAAGAFVTGFLNMDIWGKLLVGGWLVTKLGGAKALTAAGSRAGASVGAGVATGMATGMATGAAAGGGLAGLLARGAGALKFVGKTVLAVAVLQGVTEGLQVSKENLSASQSFTTWFNKMTGGVIGTNVPEQMQETFDEIARMIQNNTKLPKGWDWNRLIDNSGLKTEQEEALRQMLGFKTRADDIKRALAKIGIVVTIDTKDALEGAQSVRDALERMKTGASQDVGSLKTNIRFNMRLIRNSLSTDSKAAREAISANFSAAISNIKRSMKEGTISVKDGTALIQTYMMRSLMNFGFSKAQALNVAKDPSRKTSYTGGPEEGTRGPGHQRGGYINIGAPTGDSVHAMLERDEYVLNRKAVKKVGKAALDRLNFGSAPRFQKGGSVTGDTDVLPALLNALRAMSARAGVPIYIQSGRRTLGEQAALVGSKGLYGPGNPTGAAAASPNAPHVRGVAADITPGRAQFGSIASRFGLGFTVPTEAWHIQLLDAAAAAGAKAVSAVAQTVAGVKVLGPDSALKSLSQSAIDATQGAAQGVVNKVFSSLAPAGGGGGAAVAAGGKATGNGAALMRQISEQRGWNFADWWALDASETGHGANLANPTSSARLRGQFLDMNYGKYGPGSDPGQNPSMSQQIYSMAGYIAERYGNPTKAWAFHRAHNFYQRGGPVLASLLAAGGAVKGRGAKAKNKTIDTLLHAKTHKPDDHLSKAMVRSLKGAGADTLSGVMNTFKNNADKYADWAARANNITDTDALQTALNLEMTRRGGRSNMSQSELLKLFPAADQDSFINTWLRGNATFNGGIQTDWLSQELNQLLGWRNNLIDNPPLFQKLIDAAVKAYNKLKKEIRRIEADIKKLETKRDKAKQKEEDNHQALIEAKRDLAAEQKKKKPDKSRIARLREHVATYGEQEAAAHQDRVNYNKEIAKLRGDDRDAKAGTQVLGGDDGTGGGTGGRIGDLKQAVTDMHSSLVDVHGLGSTMARFVSPSQFQLGALGGTILNVQNEILGLTRNPTRASAEEAGADTAAPEDQSKEILAQLLREANLRTAVSQAQYGAFRNLPFGGSFAEGGTVPGPVGAPRMILAHGGEQVIANDDDGGGTRVQINVASGMEWLKQFIDVRVDNQTRTQGRRGERQLPGRAGTLR